MSKSMAIEGVMKIFLMVAVIIVGVSFLLKAFGIDIFGLLGEKFGGSGLEDSRAVFVKIDTKPKNTYEFRLVNSKFFLVDDEGIGLNFKSYFYLSEFPVDKCTLFTSEANVGQGLLKGIFSERIDKGGIYYVFPGATLQEDCGNNIKQCIDKLQLSWYGCDFREAVNKKDPCDTQCRVMKYDNGWKEDKASCASPWSYVDCDASGDDVALYYYNFKKGVPLPSNYNYCDDENLVANAKFSEYPSCGDENKCNLLDKDAGYIKIKYGLLCDGDGRWKTCSKKNDGEKNTGGMGKVSATCHWNDVGKWTPEEAIKPAQVAESPKTISLSASPTSVPADGTSTSTITAAASDNAAGKTISFTSTRTLSANSCTTGTDGKCSVTIKSSSPPGVATISASSTGYDSSSVTVTFTTPGDITESLDGWEVDRYSEWDKKAELKLDDITKQDGDYALRLDMPATQKCLLICIGEFNIYEIKYYKQLKEFSMKNSFSFSVKSNVDNVRIGLNLYDDEPHLVGISFFDEKILANKKWKTYTFSKNDFSGLSYEKFDWSRIQTIQIKVDSTKNENSVWIDAIKFS